MKKPTSGTISKIISIFLFFITIIRTDYLYAADDHVAHASSHNKTITTEELRLAEETLGNPESDQYDEDKFCEVLRKALDSDILNEADRMRAAYRIEIAAKNRPGTIASDFYFKTRTGERNSLLGFNSSKPILLLFYDPDCDHCLHTIEQLKKTDIPAKVEVLAIYAEDDSERWEETNSQLPEDWTVGYALDPIQDDETYVFITTPTLFLLTSQKTILLKDTTLPAIDELLFSQGQNHIGKDN